MLLVKQPSSLLLTPLVHIKMHMCIPLSFLLSTILSDCRTTKEQTNIQSCHHHFHPFRCYSSFPHAYILMIIVIVIIMLSPLLLSATTTAQCTTLSLHTLLMLSFLFPSSVNFPRDFQCQICWLLYQFSVEKKDLLLRVFYDNMSVSNENKRIKSCVCRHTETETKFTLAIVISHLWCLFLWLYHYHCRDDVVLLLYHCCKMSEWSLCVCT